MRNAFVLFLTLLIALSLVSPVVAKDDESDKTGDIREFISKKWPGLFKDVDKDGVGKFSGGSDDPKVKAANVQAAVKSAINKFEQREYQYQAFLDKLRSRRNKLSTSGKDVAKIDALLIELEARHTELRDLIQSEKEWMSTLDPNDTSAEKWKEAKPHVEKLQKAFKKHQAEVTSVVKALKEQTVQSNSKKPNNPSTEIRKKVIPSGYVVPPPRYKDGEDD